MNDDRYRLLLPQIIITGIAALLFLDEAWMFFPGFGYPGWLLGDWSWLHLEPFHHWMLAPVLLVFAWVFLPMILEVKQR